jgi:hypothetical protein
VEELAIEENKLCHPPDDHYLDKNKHPNTDLQLKYV